MRFSVPFILASQSPRRRKLLEQLQLQFEVHVSPAEEVVHDGMPPDEVVQVLALEKALPIAEMHPEALTLGADTLVVLDGRILGKPANPAEACVMLNALQGQTHTVFTGIALLHLASGRRHRVVEATRVTFGSLSNPEIEAYVATGSPLDKAGAYGIQDDRGAVFVERIEGDYYNVVGLPLRRLYRLLRDEFSDLMLDFP